MKITCSNDSSHDEFFVTAHVAQIWIVDQDGVFTCTHEKCSEVIHRPNADDDYVCVMCRSDAIATES